MVVLISSKVKWNRNLFSRVSSEDFSLKYHARCIDAPRIITRIHHVRLVMRFTARYKPLTSFLSTGSTHSLLYGEKIEHNPFAMEDYFDDFFNFPGMEIRHR